MKADLEILQRYLETRAISDKKYATLLTDAQGTVKSLAGYTAETALTRPVPGQNLALFHPLFEGLFPLREKNLILPNVETHPDAWYDIHLVSAGSLIWVIFEDKSEVVAQMRPSLQERNAAGRFRGNLMPAEMAFLLSELGFAVLENQGNGQYRLTGAWPAWAVQFFGEGTFRFSTDDLIRIFPYLEVFLDMREGAVIRPLASDIWTQQSANTELHLKAWWIRSKQSWYLILKKLDDTESQTDLIQRARMMNLDKEEILRSEELARQLVQTKNQFVSIVSHDLRSPFISIISALDYLFEDPAFTAHLGDEHAEFLQYIHDESKRLLDYLEKLLNWTRLDTGRLTPIIQTVNLMDIWRLTMTQFEARLREKEIRLEHNIPAEYPFEADPTLFSQVINNLLGNAVKFTPRGGNIRLLADELNGKIVLRLIDSGVGIPKEKLEVLFREYEKYYTYGTDGEKGTGLGLSICKKILDAHGYGIEVISSPGEGTEMRINLA